MLFGGEEGRVGGGGEMKREQTRKVSVGLCMEIKPISNKTGKIQLIVAVEEDFTTSCKSPGRHVSGQRLRRTKVS